MDVMEAIKGRRSIRNYRADSVDDESLNTVLESARWAPSWANTQCVRWVVVKDGAIKNRLADTLSATNPAGKAIRAVPVVLVACAETGRSGFKSGEPVTDKGDWFMFDTALAVQNLTLAAHSLGLATVQVGLFDALKAGEILQVPDGVRVVELIPLGHPDEQPKGPGRKELSEVVFKDRYGQR